MPLADSYRFCHGIVLANQLKFTIGQSAYSSHLTAACPQRAMGNNGSVNRPFSYSEKKCESNDISSQFVEFSNMHNGDRSSNAIQSNLAHQNV